MILKVQELSVHFGKLAALNNVSLEVEEGEILGLIGPNGAGKTTFFNAVTGYVNPFNGHVFYKGEKITNKQPFYLAKLGIVRTFQVTKPFKDSTVLDNVIIGAFIRTSSIREAKKCSEEILEVVHLGEKTKKFARELTVPDMKRLELAKALVTKPKLLFLDEVMAGLTPSETEELVQIIRNLNKNGITMIVVEHIMRAVMALSGRIFVLDCGEKIAEGTPEEISQNDLVRKAYLGEEYANEYVKNRKN